MSRSALLILALISGLFMGCRSGITAPASGPVVTEWRTVGTFDGLEVSRAMEVIVREGASDSIRLDVSEGYLPYIRTEVRDGVLSVYVENDVELDNLDANDVTIWVPTLNGIAASGASVVRVVDTLRAPDIILVASGASTMNVNAISDRIEVNYSGASVLDLSGTATRFRPDPVSGASVIRAFDLTSNRTETTVSGASILETTTTDTLQVIASGASIVRYRGQPHISSELSGGSLIEDGN